MCKVASELAVRYAKLLSFRSGSFALNLSPAAAALDHAGGSALPQTLIISY